MNCQLNNNDIKDIKKKLFYAPVGNRRGNRNGDRYRGDSFYKSCGLQYLRIEIWGLHVKKPRIEYGTYVGHSYWLGEEFEIIAHIGYLNKKGNRRVVRFPNKNGTKIYVIDKEEYVASMI